MKFDTNPISKSNAANRALAAIDQVKKRAARVLRDGRNQDLISFYYACKDAKEILHTSVEDGITEESLLAELTLNTEEDYSLQKAAYLEIKNVLLDEIINFIVLNKTEILQEDFGITNTIRIPTSEATRTEINVKIEKLLDKIL